MLAAHRDQENVVRDHGVLSKQSNKSHALGAKEYSKTPGKLPFNDENAPTGLGAKSARGNQNLIFSKGRNPEPRRMTPTLMQSRAPLGEKTTNAKARSGLQGGKSTVKNIQQGQNKPASSRKVKQQSRDLSQLKFTIKADAKQSANENEEPEYAPLHPVPLPFSSDLLPEGGLTFEGLKAENVFRGSGESEDPTDGVGKRRSERELDREIKTKTSQISRSFQLDSKGQDWNTTPGMPQSAKSSLIKPDGARDRIDQNIRRRHERVASTISSRQAVASLSVRMDNKSKNTVPVKASKFVSKPPTHSRAFSSNNITGEVLSRTTIGYNKGKSAGAILRSRGEPLQLGRSLSRRGGPREREGFEFDGPGAANATGFQSYSPNISEHTGMAAGSERSELDVSRANTKSPAFMALFYPDSEEDDLTQIDLPDELSDFEKDGEVEEHFDSLSLREI